VASSLSSDQELVCRVQVTEVNSEDNKTNKMHKLILGLIYDCSITPTFFGPLIEAIIRESKILECYKAFTAICLNVMWMYSRRV
jgi:hypothetical protein